MVRRQASRQILIANNYARLFLTDPDGMTLVLLQEFKNDVGKNNIRFPAKKYRVTSASMFLPVVQPVSYGLSSAKIVLRHG